MDMVAMTPLGLATYQASGEAFHTSFHPVLPRILGGKRYYLHCRIFKFRAFRGLYPE